MPRISAKRHHNLPAQRVRLIGREQDLRAAAEALSASEGRLLTLTGTGGCGKTRLALELAWRASPGFANGVVLVELAPCSDPAQVPHPIAAALGVRELPGEPLTATLIRTLAALELLLVLDNCEHLIAACARLTEQLLDSCPRLRVLATSREPLRIPGERTWRVPSLAVPRQGAGAEEARGVTHGYSWKLGSNYAATLRVSWAVLRALYCPGLHSAGSSSSSASRWNASNA